MTQCRVCSAVLPEQARFCLQCGTPVSLEEAEQTDPQQPSLAPQPKTPPPPLDFVQPAVAGGMFLGILSSLPFIGLANCLCCMWVLLGGGIASVLLTRQRPSGITYGDGAFVGVLSGLFGSIVGTIVHIPMHIISTRLFGSDSRQIEELLQRMEIEGPMRDWMLRVMSGELSAVTILFTFFSYLLTWSLFAMIGGILAVALLNKRAQGKSPLAGL